MVDKCYLRGDISVLCHSYTTVLCFIFLWLLFFNFYIALTSQMSNAFTVDHVCGTLIIKDDHEKSSGLSSSPVANKRFVFLLILIISGEAEVTQACPWEFLRGEPAWNPPRVTLMTHMHPYPCVLWRVLTCLCSAAGDLRHGALGETSRGVQAPSQVGRRALWRSVGGSVDRREQASGY